MTPEERRAATISALRRLQSPAPSRPSSAPRRSRRDAEWSDRAGFVLSRKNRQTGAVIGLYRSAESGIESDPELPWTTVCEAHGLLVCHATRALAELAMAVPDWCEECQAVLERKSEAPQITS